MALASLALYLTETGAIQSPKLLETLCAARLCSDESLEMRARSAVETAERVRLYRMWVDRDPSSPERWCDLGEALLRAGDRAEAERSFDRARQLGSTVPAVLLRLGKAQVEMRRPREQMPYTKAVLRLSGEHNATVFAAYDHAGFGVEEVLAEGMPDSAEAGYSYLQHLEEKGDEHGARAVWQWLIHKGYRDHSTAIAYTEFLVGKGLWERAAKSWGQFSGESAGGVFNGGFEAAFSGAPVDWKVRWVKGAEVERDTQVAADGKASLRIRFDGTENLDYRNVEQSVWLEPGSYRLVAKVKSDGLTTNRGVQLRVKAGAQETVTEAVTGSEDWKTVAAPFDVSPGLAFVTVQIVRQVSEQFNNRIHGTAWVDDVKVSPQPSK